MTKLLIGIGLVLAIGISAAVFYYSPTEPTNTPFPTATPTLTTTPTQTRAPLQTSFPGKTPPAGCYYQEVTCVTEPCYPELVCPDSTSGSCYRGGCSGQLCTDNPDAVSTCEYRAEYSCYRDAECKRQENGNCGWTQTSQLKYCLSNPPSSN